MMKNNKDKLDLFLVIFASFFVWMISVGIYPLLTYFSDPKFSLQDLYVSLFWIAVIYAIIAVLIFTWPNLKEKIRKSQDLQTFSSKWADFTSTKLFSRILKIGIPLGIFLYLLVGFWGTTEIDKPFNRFDYEVIYEANIARSPEDRNLEKIYVWVTVERGLFFGRTVYLDYLDPYIGVKNKLVYVDDWPTLEVGKFVYVNTVEGDEFDDIYIQLTNTKVGDYNEVY